MKDHVIVCIATLIVIAGLAPSASAQFGMAGPEIKHEVLTGADGVHPGGELRIAITFKLSSGWHVNSNTPRDAFVIPTVFTVEEGGPAAPAQVVYPEEKLVALSFSPEKVAVYEEAFAVGLVIAVLEDAAPGAYTLNGQLRYQACNDKTCAPPKEAVVSIPLNVVAVGTPVSPKNKKALDAIVWGEAADSATPKPEASTAAEATSQGPGENWRALADQFTVAGRLDGYANTEGFLDFIERAETGQQTENALAGKSWWLIILAVVAGGFLLNLTPCVLPLIPINVAIIGAGARAGSKARGFALGGAYGLGISLVYGALGLLVVLGLSSTFGNINSSPWFNGGIAVLFFFLGLAMFEIINIDFSKYQAKIGIRKNENGSFLVAFAMGSISALLAGACVAPVVIYTIVYAQDQYSQGNPAAVLLPFLLGVGMALPWPFAGAGLSFLPKPGVWMTRVKQGFGVFIIAFALYYGYEAYSLVAPGKGHGPTEGWTESLEEGLAQAQAENKPVLVDFWATWCKNCLVMDKTVLRDDAVNTRLEDYVKVKFQAEDLSKSPVKDVAEYYEVLGLPTFVVLEPKAR